MIHALICLLLALPLANPHPDWPVWVTDLGGGTPNGASLEVTGTLTPNNVLWLQCWELPPSKNAIVLAGTAYLGVPFSGGTIVPQPLLGLYSLTSFYGTLGLPLALPSDIPSTGKIYAQVWAAKGKSWVGSNAVMIDLSKS